MRPRTLLASALALVAAAIASPPASAYDQTAVVPGRYIVVYKPSVTSAAAVTRDRARELDLHPRLRFSHALKGFSAPLDASQLASLRNDPSVDFVAPVRRVEVADAVPLAPGEPIPPTGVRRVLAGTDTTAREASGVSVAVIDTGIDLAHQDLNAKAGTNCVDPGAPPNDDHGHGTHVAGTIAARNDGAGVTGVAPGTEVYAVKVLDSEGAGTTEQVVCGIDWVAANAASKNIAVANMSLLGYDSSDAGRTCETTTNPLRVAICRATANGVTFAVAAGNDGAAFDADTDAVSPAQFPEVLTVTAMTDTDGRPGALGGFSCTGGPDDSFGWFSDYAATAAGATHTIAGPGDCIESTAPGGGYATKSGTSMATPHVAALLALCRNEGGRDGRCAGRSPAETIQVLRDDAASFNASHPDYGFDGDPVHEYPGYYFGYLAHALDGPPETAIDDAPAGVVGPSDAELRFSSPRADATFECQLDSGPWHACGSPQTYPGLADGAHTVAVRAVAAGLPDPTPAVAAFSVDATPPDTSIDASPPAFAAPTAGFRLSSPDADARFECSVDAAPWEACASPARYTDLSDGTHSLSVRAIDAVGNADPTPAIKQFTIDTTAPDITLRVRSPQRVDGDVPRASFGVRCDGEPCDQSVSAYFQRGDAKYRGVSISRAAGREGATRWTVSLTGATGRRAVTAALQDGRTASLHALVTVTDALGNSATRNVLVRLVA